MQEEETFQRTWSILVVGIIEGVKAKQRCSQTVVGSELDFTLLGHSANSSTVGTSVL